MLLQLLRFIAFFLMGSISGIADPTLESAKELQIKYNELQNWISQLSPQACFSEEGLKQSPICSLEQACKKTQNTPNGYYLNLYQTSQGHAVRNQALTQLQISSQSCYNQTIKDIAENAVKDATLRGHEKKLQNDHQIETELKNALQKNPEQYELYLEFVQFTHNQFQLDPLYLKKNQIHALQDFKGKKGNIFLPESISILKRFIERNRKEQETYLQQLYQANQLEKPILKLLDHKLKTDHLSTNQKNKRLQEIFEETKKDAIRWLQLTDSSIENKKNLQQRIQNLKLTPHSETQTQNSFGGFALCNISFNAFYDSTKGTVSICSRYGEWPRQMLVHVFLHEIAHSIGPCTLIKKSGSNEVIPEYTQHHPFQTQIDCLKENNSEQVHSLKKENVQIFHEENIQKIQNIFNEVSDLSDQEQAILFYRLENSKKTLSELNKNPSNIDCIKTHDTQGPSQIEEAFADLIALEVSYQHLKSSPPKNRAVLGFESILPWITQACFGESGSLEFLKLKLKNVCPQLQGQEFLISPTVRAEIKKHFPKDEENWDAHPNIKTRVDDLFFKNPKIASTLGCPPSNKKTCEFGEKLK